MAMCSSAGIRRAFYPDLLRSRALGPAPAFVFAGRTLNPAYRFALDPTHHSVLSPAPA